MALPVPIEMPTPLAVNRKKFDLNYVQSISPAGSQFMQSIERAPPMWVAQYSTPPLNPERDQVFQAFLDSLEQSMVPFLAFDPRRSRPYAYRNIAGAPWLRPNYTKVLITRASFADGTISLAGLASGTVLTPTDYIAYNEGNRWWLFRLRTGGVADANGSLPGLKVSPRPPTFIGLRNARLDRPCCTMKLVGSITKDDSVQDLGPSYSFDAVQFKDRSESAYNTNLMPLYDPTVAQLSNQVGTTNATEPASPPIAGLNWLMIDNSGGSAYAYQTTSGLTTSGVDYLAQIIVNTPDGSPPVYGSSPSTGEFSFNVAGSGGVNSAAVELVSGNNWLVTSRVTALASGASGILRYNTQGTRALKFTGFNLRAMSGG